MSSPLPLLYLCIAAAHLAGARGEVPGGGQPRTERRTGAGVNDTSWASQRGGEREIFHPSRKVHRAKALNRKSSGF